MNNDYKRTLIGKLNVVKNNRLRKLFTKGLKLCVAMCWKKARANIITSLEDCIDTSCVKNGQFNSILIEWKQKIIETLDIKIKNLLEKSNSNHF